MTTASPPEPAPFQLRVRRKDFHGYVPWLQDQEYRLLKQRIVDLLRGVARPSDALLDVACWDGEATQFYGVQLGLAELHGVDFFATQVDTARRRGVTVTEADLEHGTFPYEDGRFDLVVANQIFEHLKQIYRPMDEIHRVLRPGGHLVLSVPNLAALHCRLQLLAGRQPSTIQLFEAHVRGFAPRDLQAFLTHNGLFEHLAWIGSGLYPFPPALSSRLARRLRSIAVYQLHLLRRTDVHAAGWHAEIERRGVQSNF